MPEPDIRRPAVRDVLCAMTAAGIHPTTAQERAFIAEIGRLMARERAAMIAADARAEARNAEWLGRRAG